MTGGADELAARVRQQISSGELPEGAKLPSIGEYMKQGYSRGVAGRVLDALRAEGWIVARQGAGFYVAKRFKRVQRVSPGRLLEAHWGEGKAIQDHDTGDRWRDVTPIVGDVVPPLDVAEVLGVASGVPVLARRRVFIIDERRVQLATSYLPTELTRGTRIEHSNTGQGGIYARLKEQGWGPTFFVEKVSARAAIPDEVETLDLRRGGLVFEITRLAYSGDRCVEVARMVLDVEVYDLVYEIDPKYDQDSRVKPLTLT